MLRALEAEVFEVLDWKKGRDCGWSCSRRKIMFLKVCGGEADSALSTKPQRGYRITLLSY